MRGGLRILQGLDTKVVASRLVMRLALVALWSCAGGDGTDEGEAGFVPGQSYFSPTGYVEYIAGDAPVIVTSPHGGYLRPAGIADRQIADTNQDDYTQELTRAIDSVFAAATGHHPHVVICRLHRVKIDCNRDLDEAALGNPVAEQVWAEFHALIDTAKASVVAQFGHGLLLDIHGHGRPIDRIEIGYALEGEQVDLPDDVLDDPTWVDSTSIRDVQVQSGVTLPELLRGNSALGTLLADRSYPSVPSGPDPRLNGDPYFTGGYNTRRHGSQEGGSISAVQMELYRPGLRDSDSTRQAFAAGLVESLQAYFTIHFGVAL